MARRGRHTREELREMSVAAAELILVREGYAALSMRKVADAIGYTAGQLYLLFENQDELLASINERTADAVQVRLEDAAAQAQEPLQRLRALAAAYIEFAHRHTHRFRLLFEHPLPVAHTPRASADRRIERSFGLVEQALAPLLPGLGSKALRNAATTLWSGVHGICMLAVSGRLQWSGASDVRPHSDALVTAFVAGHGVTQDSLPRHESIKPRAHPRRHESAKDRKEGAGRRR